MSLKTWKAEFYPVAPKKSMTTKDAIEHSLKKWIGLRKGNLKKHDVMIQSFNILCDVGSGRGFLEINASSCALCKKFFVSMWETVEGIGCPQCPLRAVLGKVCDDNEVELSVYGEFIEDGNPEPMIRALEKTLRRYKDDE